MKQFLVHIQNQNDLFVFQKYHKVKLVILCTFHVTFQFTFVLEINIAEITFDSQSGVENRDRFNYIKIEEETKKFPRNRAI